MTEEDKDKHVFWKVDHRLLTKRKTMPFEPTPLEEEEKVTSKQKFEKAVVEFSGSVLGLFGRRH